MITKSNISSSDIRKIDKEVRTVVLERCADRLTDRPMDTQTDKSRHTSDREKKGSSVIQVKTDWLTGSAQTTSALSTLHKNNPFTNTSCTCFICVH